MLFLRLRTFPTDAELHEKCFQPCYALSDSKKDHCMLETISAVACPDGRSRLFRVTEHIPILSYYRGYVRAKGKKVYGYAYNTSDATLSIDELHPNATVFGVKYLYCKTCEKSYQRCKCATPANNAPVGLTLSYQWTQCSICHEDAPCSIVTATGTGSNAGRTMAQALCPSCESANVDC